MAESRVDRLIQDGKETIAKLLDIMIKLEAATKGENPVGEVIARWKAAWKKKYGAEYELSSADAGNMKRLVTKRGKDDAAARLGRYINDNDPWLVRQRHPLAAFWSRENGYGKTVHETVEDGDTPSGCSHRPPCKTDAEHTSKKMQEMRA